MNFSGALRSAGREHALSVVLEGDALRGSLDGAPVGDLRVERRDGAVVLRRGRAATRALVARDGARLLVHLAGRVHEFAIVDAEERGRGEAGRRRGADEPFAASPMTGTVAEVPVKPGDAVAAGGTLAVVEAMKMQFVVRAPRDVVVKEVRVAAGRSVDIGAVLVEFVE